MRPPSWWRTPSAVVHSLAPLMFACAWAYYHLLLRPLAKRSHFESTVGTVLVTVGTLLMLSDLTAKAAGATQRNIQLRLPAIEFGEIVISTTQVLGYPGVSKQTTGAIIRRRGRLAQLVRAPL